MTFPNLLIQYQCTAPSCSRMSSPLNILSLLPTIDQLMSNTTTQIPFVTMRLKHNAEQSCPFCHSPSRIVPVDPSFQGADLRSALRVMFGSFFGHAGPDILEAQNVQWMPVQAPGNETSNTSQGTRVQWVLVGGQVHQLLISASPLAKELQQINTQRRGSGQASSTPGSGSGSRNTPTSATQPTSSIQSLQKSNMASQNRLFPSLNTSVLQQHTPLLPRQQQQSTDTSEIFSALTMSPFNFSEDLSQITFPQTNDHTATTNATATQLPSWADFARRGGINTSENDSGTIPWPSNWPLEGP